MNPFQPPPTLTKSPTPTATNGGAALCRCSNDHTRICGVGTWHSFPVSLLHLIDVNSHNTWLSKYFNIFHWYKTWYSISLFTQSDVQQLRQVVEALQQVGGFGILPAFRICEAFGCSSGILGNGAQCTSVMVNVYLSWRGCGLPQSVIEHWVTSESSWPFDRKDVHVNKLTKKEKNLCEYGVIDALRKCVRTLWLLCSSAQRADAPMQRISASFLLRQPISTFMASSGRHIQSWRHGKKFIVIEKKTSFRRLLCNMEPWRAHVNISLVIEISMLRNAAAQPVYKKCGCIEENRNPFGSAPTKNVTSAKSQLFTPWCHIL